MKKIFVLLAIILIGSCSTSDDVEPIEVGEFVSEILSYTIGEAAPSQKVVLQNDGEKYTYFERYLRPTSGANRDLVLVGIYHVTYDAQGRISRVEDYAPNNPAFPLGIYEYFWYDEHYTFNYYRYQLGDYWIDADYDIIYFNQPENGFRLWNGVVYAFENGNLVGYGYENEDEGNLEAFGKNWIYQRSILFDDQPNIYSNPVIDFALGQRNLIRSMNANNYVGIILPTGDVYQWEITTQDGKPVAVKNVAAGFNRTEFIY